MATASVPCTVVWTSPTLGARWINRATGLVLRKRIDVYLFVDNETRLGARAWEIKHWHARTMSSEFVSKCQRADGNRGLNQ